MFESSTPNPASHPRLYSLRYHAHGEEGWWPTFSSILSHCGRSGWATKRTESWRCVFVFTTLAMDCGSEESVFFGLVFDIVSGRGPGKRRLLDPKFLCFFLDFTIDIQLNPPLGG